MTDEIEKQISECLFELEDSNWNFLLNDTLKLLSRRLETNLLVFWAFNPVRNIIHPLSYVGLKSDDVDILQNLEIHKQNINILIERRRTIFRETIEAELFYSIGINPQTTYKTVNMVIVPFLNTVNMNQIILFLTIIADEHQDVANDQFWEKFARRFSFLYESKLREECLRYSYLVLERIADTKTTDIEILYDKIIRVVKNAIACEAVTLFLQNPKGSELLFRKSTVKVEGEDIRWGNEELGLTGKIWKNNRERILNGTEYDQERHKVKVVESIEKKSVMLLPIRDSKGSSVGVIRCINKKEGNRDSQFDYSDGAIIESIMLASYTQLQSFIQEEQRRINISKLVHELRTPAWALRTLLNRLKKEIINQNVNFDYPIIENLEGYIEIVRLNLNRQDIFVNGVESIKLNKKPTNIKESVIQPVISFVRLLALEKGLDSKRINTSLQYVPIVHVDSFQLQEVVFNLIENALKYVKLDNMKRPIMDQFKIFVKLYFQENDIYIDIEDNGIGVLNDSNNIFEVGERGLNAIEHNVMGQGLGLWMSNAIIKKHKGHLILAKNCNPTIFRVKIPLDYK